MTFDKFWGIFSPFYRLPSSLSLILLVSSRFSAVDISRVSSAALCPLSSFSFVLSHGFIIVFISDDRLVPVIRLIA